MEKTLKSNYLKILATSLMKDSNLKTSFVKSQNLYEQTKKIRCKMILGQTDEGDESGIAQIACALAEAAKRNKELELILAADKEGTNQAFFEAFNDMIEVRNPDVDLKKVRNQSGARIINTEFKSALGAISEHPWIKEGKLRIKSMRLVNEGDQSQCADASKYLFELGYYALPTEKYVMVFVKSDVTKGSDGKRVINKIRTSIQENLNDVPVCP
jgi:hypothetical protein